MLGKYNPYFAGILYLIEGEHVERMIPIITCLVRIPTLTFKVELDTKYQYKM
jgi:hypothetical protein